MSGMQIQMLESGRHMTHGLQCVVKEMKPTQVIRTNSDILQLAASCWVCPNHLPAKVKNVISHLMIFLDQQKTSLREWPTFPTFSASQQIFHVAKSHKIQSRPLRKQDCFSERDSGSLQSPTGKCLEVTHLFQTQLSLQAHFLPQLGIWITQQLSHGKPHLDHLQPTRNVES